MSRITLPRRTLLKSAAAASGLAALPTSLLISGGSTVAKAETELDTSTVLEENGHLTQTWFLESFLELADDIKDASDQGKRFAIIWQQKGCPYCRETHLVNFSTPVIRDWIRERFSIVALDIWGSREVTDFDGTQMEERDLAGKSNITFTPTIQFFPANPDEVIGKVGAEAEIMRMPGYFRRFHFITMFEYIYENANTTENFQRYLIAKVQRIQDSGGEPDVW